MPKVGIEPTIPKEHDFESCASACSATSAGTRSITIPLNKVKMKLGIIGLPQSGKTTIFNALTGGNTPTSASAGRFEVHTAVVDVPDPRVTRLSEMFRPRKTIYAKVTYADIAGLEAGSAKSGISGQLLNQLAQMDAYLHVVRCFQSDLVSHPSGSVDPARDANGMTEELLLNDLITVERKLEKLTEERKKGGTDKADNERQTALFQRLHAALSENIPLRKVEIPAEEVKRRVWAIIEGETKANLAKVLGGPDTPALLFSASHGMGFPDGHERQFLDQVGPPDNVVLEQLPQLVQVAGLQQAVQLAFRQRRERGVAVAHLEPDLERRGGGRRRVEREPERVAGEMNEWARDFFGRPIVAD